MSEEYSISSEPAGFGGSGGQRCTGCGYELAGLSAKGICPECGHRYGEEFVITGFTNRGGPTATLVIGILFLLIGLSDIALRPLTVSMFFLSLVNPCSVLGLILLGSGLDAISQSRSFGGNLRWVLGPEGLYSIRGTAGVRNTIRWNQIRRFKAARLLPFYPGGWRMLKVKRRWHSVDVFRRRSPELWLKGCSRSEVRELVDRCNQLLQDWRENGLRPEDEPGKPG